MEKIKELRIERNLTQQELANKLGITNKSVWAYETGYAIPPIETLIKIADIFNCSLDYLVGREDDFGYIISEDSESSLSNDEKFLLFSYRKLNNDEKRLLTKLLNCMIKDS